MGKSVSEELLRLFGPNKDHEYVIIEDDGEKVYMWQAHIIDDTLWEVGYDFTKEEAIQIANTLLAWAGK